MPAAYRVDLYNLLQKKLVSNIKFCFLRELRIDYKKSIGVFEEEPFLRHSTFYEEKIGITRAVHLLVNLVADCPDVVINVGMSPRTIFICLYCKIFRKKLFIWWGGTDLSEKNIYPVKYLYRKLIARYADGVVFYSKLALEYYQRLTRKDFRYVILGNNTRDSTRYHQKIITHKKPKKSENIKLVTVGFQSKRKNTIALLKAMQIIQSNANTVKLVIAGDGPELNTLKSFCNINKLENVTFLGHVTPPEMIKVFANADIFIHPSLIDQWPQTYNEAAAAGLPILISNNSGVYNDYIEEYGDIALFNPKNHEQIALSIKRLAKDKALRISMGRKALQVALAHDATFAAESLIKFITFSAQLQVNNK